MWITEICIGTSTTGLVVYLLSKIRCVIKNPCSCSDAMCVYGSNEATFNNISDDDNEIVISSAKNQNQVYVIKKICEYIINGIPKNHSIKN